METSDLRIKSRTKTQRTSGSSFSSNSQLSKIKWQYSSRKTSVTSTAPKECTFCYMKIKAGIFLKPEGKIS